MDPLELTPDRYLNLIYYWLVKDATQRQRSDFDMQLEIPPASVESAEVEDDEAWSAESEMAAFRQAQQAASG